MRSFNENCTQKISCSRFGFKHLEENQLDIPENFKEKFSSDFKGQNFLLDFFIWKWMKKFQQKIFSFPKWKEKSMENISSKALFKKLLSYNFSKRRFATKSQNFPLKNSNDLFSQKYFLNSEFLRLGSWNKLSSQKFLLLTFSSQGTLLCRPFQKSKSKEKFKINALLPISLNLCNSVFRNFLTLSSIFPSSLYNH